MNNYINIYNLEAYKTTKSCGDQVWNIYNIFNWKQQKILGDQLIRSADSIEANIAEGYGRFHYLDKIKFYYNARGSLLETQHWIQLAYERKMINNIIYEECIHLLKKTSILLNGLIKSQYQQKNNLNSPYFPISNFSISFL